MHTLLFIKICIMKIATNPVHIVIQIDCFLIAESFKTYGVGRIRSKIRQYLENS